MLRIFRHVSCVLCYYWTVRPTTVNVTDRLRSMWLADYGQCHWPTTVNVTDRLRSMSLANGGQWLWVCDGFYLFFYHLPSREARALSADVLILREQSNWTTDRVSWLSDAAPECCTLIDCWPCCWDESMSLADCSQLTLVTLTSVGQWHSLQSEANDIHCSAEAVMCLWLCCVRNDLWAVSPQTAQRPSLSWGTDEIFVRLVTRRSRQQHQRVSECRR